MNNQEYETKKRECWEEFRKEHPEISCKSLLRNFVDFIFDRAYALGKLQASCRQVKEEISQEEIEKAAEDYVSFEKGGKCYPNYIVERACCRAFKDGANFALGKQEGPSKNSSEIKRELSKNSSESTPAEPKFKVGDIVRYRLDGKRYEVMGKTGKYHYALNGYDSDVLESDLEPYTEPKNEVEKMKPIKSYVKVYLATKEEDEEFRTLLYKNGFMWSSGTALISLSNWDSALEDSHIHFVYHDKTVTYLGERTKETLTFTEFKKRYFGEDVNLSQETVNCDKQFDNILKDGFHDHNRLHIASIIMSGLLASSKEKHPVRRAMDLADALIAECDKEGGEE